jgi:hypothetical protein
MLIYNNNRLDFKFLSSTLKDDYDPKAREAVFQFLRAHKDDITDDAVLGIVLFLEQNNWNLTLLKSKYKRLGHQTFVSKRKKRFEQKKINYGIAAVVILFIGIGYFFNYNTSSSILDYAPTESGLPNFLNADTKNNLWSVFMEAYSKEDYQKAQSELKVIEKDLTKSNDTLQYFLGITSLQLKAYDQAATHFKTLKTEERSVFKLDSDFYLMLSLLATNKKPEAKVYLDQMLKDSLHPYHSNSKEILFEFYKEK